MLYRVEIWRFAGHSTVTISGCSVMYTMRGIGDRGYPTPTSFTNSTANFTFQNMFLLLSSTPISFHRRTLHLPNHDRGSIRQNLTAA